ncbi:RNA polymerase sigma-70 factor [Sunxiuqinia indica]|uniref:RNA polymerase sigma-70 factor n=1 Tax=Sunxiuqinia indica TaxID=2692584 RepID=UPI00135C909A|nr:RNA polymerase sigma-70 factor [Sunxiuqinia indica]
MSVENEKNKSDNELFQDFLNGNNLYFSYFFDKYYRGLCVYAYKMIGSESAAEDLVQDLFVKIWENRSKFSIKANVKSYFLRAVHNKCLDFIAHQNIKASHRSYHLSHFSEAELLDYPLMDFELEERLKQAIDSLPKGIRETYIMNRIDGLTYQQIAEKEGVSVKAIEYRMSRAISLLREDLKEYLLLALLFLTLQ